MIDAFYQQALEEQTPIIFHEYPQSLLIEMGAGEGDFLVAVKYLHTFLDAVSGTSALRVDFATAVQPLYGEV